MNVINTFIALFVESAPFLLGGMLLAGLIHQLVPRRWVEKTLGQKDAVVTAAMIGAPLPLCSCSVIPVAMGVRESGASKASTASFLVATPETGVDSIGITYALMGPVMAIVRPIVAILSAIVTGLGIAAFCDNSLPPPAEKTGKSCCAGKSTTPTHSLTEKLSQAVSYGFGKLLSDFMGWLLIGLGFAALISTYVPEDFLTQHGNGLIAMLLAIAISIPMYVCATASTPIAAGLMLSGLSPGVALVFMLTGPATNIATLMVVKNSMGTKALGIYLLSISVCAIASGLALDTLLAMMGWSITVNHGHHHDMVSTIYVTSAWVLAALIARQYAIKLRSTWQGYRSKHLAS